MSGSKILIVEDDRNLLDTLVYNIKKEGYTVITSMNGEEAVESARREKPDIIILDIMLPGLNGLEVCRILRKEMTVPILILTARNEEVDKIIGLEVGADDYMTKPFSMRELLARVRALLRRAGMTVTQPDSINKTIIISNLEIDTERHRITVSGQKLELSPKAYDLLVFLAVNRGFVFSREQLLEKVWGYDFAGDTRTVDVHIRWLRQKIETDPSKPEKLITVRGAGYKLAE
ncbi:MAG: DNA-binding response regulator [Chloroflexi bacterium RBG_13_46_14]|nr:MAG: DNA-binding response regulator [Chloroflexi bacterium RBG_13_46_14]